MVSFEIKDAFVMDRQCDFIYNSFHLTHPSQKHMCVHITCDQETFSVPVRFEGNTAHLGIWLYEVPETVLEKLCRFVFREWPHIEQISYQNSPQHLTERQNCINTEHNHWKILLPADPDELRQRLSSKKRYNIKREKRLVLEQLGTYEILEYTTDSVPEDVVNAYFTFKRSQFGTDYQTTAAGYLKQYHVSHIYVLQLQDTIGSIVMSCEQGAYVYLENLAYNSEYSKYSLGAILYDIFLERLVKKGKKGIYLGYGQHQYKSMYGAIEQTVYTGTVFRSKYLFIKKILLPRYHRKLRSLGGKIFRKLKSMHCLTKSNSSNTTNNKEKNT